MISWNCVKENFVMKKEDTKACVISCEEVSLHKTFDELFDDTLDLI